MQNRILKYCLLLLFMVSVPGIVVAQNDAAQNARAADDEGQTFILSGTIFDDELMELNELGSTAISVGQELEVFKN